MDRFDLEKKLWWQFVSPDLKDLLRESVFLLELAGKIDNEFVDYAFVVFPAAKAYEGFLKELFLKKGYISREEYRGRRFRIGKALNPSLEKRFRNESVYDRIVTDCGGRQLADKLWQTWKTSRNMIFHWFPNQKNTITLFEAKERLILILEAIDMAWQECQIKG